MMSPVQNCVSIVIKRFNVLNFNDNYRSDLALVQRREGMRKHKPSWVPHDWVRRGATSLYSGGSLSIDHRAYAGVQLRYVEHILKLYSLNNAFIGISSLTQ